MGAMRGPKSFVAAAEHSDGCHHALSYTRAAYDYAAENLRAGAEKAGKDWTTLDFGAWVVVAVGRDSEAAKNAARSMVGIYASSMPAEDRKSTRLNSSHGYISYAVFCLKKKKKNTKKIKNYRT